MPFDKDFTTPNESKGFIGERYDGDAGLQYLNARYYDPKLGMFIQPDWWEVTKAGVGTNRYSYSFDDPVNKSDQTGHLTYDTKKDQFSSDKHETARSIAKSTGLRVDNIQSLNSGLTADGSIKAGTIINILRTSRVQAATEAARHIGDTSYSKAANLNDKAPAGAYKCNAFVGAMIKFGFGSAPTYTRISLQGSIIAGFTGYVPYDATQTGLSASAAQWSRAQLSGMTSVSQSEAVFVDVAASDNGLAGSLIPTQLGGASGHSGIYTGDVSIIDQNGNLNTPVGGWGMVGARTDTVNYRNESYLTEHNYVMNFTRYGG